MMSLTFYQNMRKICLFTVAIAFLFFACDPTKNDNNSTFTINAEIIGVEDATPIYLKMVKDGKLTPPLDTANIQSAKVSFTGELDVPEMVYLQIGDTRKMINLFGENGSISVIVHVDSLDKARVTGSDSHDDLMAFKKFLEPIDEKSIKLNEEYQAASANNDTERMNELREMYEQIRVEQIAMIKKFIVDNNESFVAPFLIKGYLYYDMEYPALDSLLSKLSPSIYSSNDYIALVDRVNTLRSVSIGMPAVDFALNDTTGNPISISSFQGKILLIDFWASWCGPCRRENPNVVQLYNDYKDKGFEIIGVSFDESRAKWIDAIHQDQLEWPHVSDLKGWSSAAGKLYAVNAIPATVLLDREGKIIAKGLRGDALRKKLEEIYGAEDQNI
jgi:peroxiredoxin